MEKSGDPQPVHHTLERKVMLTGRATASERPANIWTLGTAYKKKASLDQRPSMRMTSVGTVHQQMADANIRQTGNCVSFTIISVVFETNPIRQNLFSTQDHSRGPLQRVQLTTSSGHFLRVPGLPSRPSHFPTHHPPGAIHFSSCGISSGRVNFPFR